MPLEKVGLEAVFDTKAFVSGVNIYKRGVQEVNQGAVDAARQSQQSSQMMAQSWQAGFASIAMKAAAAILAFKGIQQATQFLSQATQLAARVETLGVSLAVVGKNAGYTEEQIAGFEEAVKAQGITSQAARQSLLMMAQAQIDWTQAAGLARIAQDAAVIANVNSSEAFEQLTYIIQTGSVVMARRLGLQVSFEAAYKKTADALGKTTDELTDGEKVQARVNVVMEAGSRIAGTYEAAMGTAGKQALSLARYIEEITLAIGGIGLGAFSVGIQELTRLLKDFQKWLKDNEQTLGDLGDSITMLADAMVEFADLELPIEELTKFVENLTTLISVLSVGIETVSQFKKENQLLFDVLSALNKVAVWPVALLGEGIDKVTEFRKANEDLFKTEEQLRTEYLERYKDDNKDWWKTTRDRWDKIREEEAAAEAARLTAQQEAAEKTAKVVQETFDRIEDMQRDHGRKLVDMEDDYNFARARAWAKYEQDVGKEITKGRQAIAKLEAKYQEDRAKAIADYNERVVEAEKELAKDITKAQADFAMRERQTRERYNLDRIQGERRYQYDRARLVAEGDTLAIEEMDARYKLEQQEAAENEALRQKQAKETQDILIEAMETAAREQGRALAEALAEQLAELKEQSRKEIEEQEQTNRDRLGEMAATYADQQRMADEDYQRSIDKANLNYQRQQEDMGRDLARKEELQGLSAEAIRLLLEQYYGPGGITTNIMTGYFEGLEKKAEATADAVILAMRGMTQAVELGGITAGHPATGYGVGMDVGGVVVGPQTVRVGAGVVEAFTPLGNVGGGGGSFDLSWSGGPIPISGLETASPTNVNEFAKALAMSLTEKIRARRRR